MHKVELLAPAGDLEKLQFALHYGADAVYVGGEKFSLRQRAGNFTLDQLDQARRITREQGKKLYVAVNVFARNNDIQELPAYLKMVDALKVDGLIIADPGVFLCAREYAPTLPVTISTQANNCNFRTVQFWQDLGAKKICLARELTLPEIKEIRKKTTLDLEVFIHGSMCIAYSGRCLLSSYFLQRDSNQGDCAQPCRWKYHLVEEIKPKDPFVIEEDSLGTYLLSSRDLCMIEHIPELIGAGINSFKIEGRMKSVYYVSMVTKVYRAAVDAYYQNLHSYQFQEVWLAELQKLSQRGITTGFYYDPHPHHAQWYHEPAYSHGDQMLGIINEKTVGKRAKIMTCNQVRLNDTIDIFRKNEDGRKARVAGLWNGECEAVDILHPGVTGTLEVDEPLYQFDILLKKRKW
ncbi:MAG: U32 family peptidase [bacterium]